MRDNRLYRLYRHYRVKLKLPQHDHPAAAVHQCYSDAFIRCISNILK